jgi:hypothetical protein
LFNRAFSLAQGELLGNPLLVQEDQVRFQKMDAETLRSFAQNQFNPHTSNTLYYTADAQ